MHESEEIAKNEDKTKLQFCNKYTVEGYTQLTLCLQLMFCIY